MNKLKQAARQALEALESKLGETHPFAHDLEKAAAIRTLREALDEQAEQEPVAWGYFDSLGAFIDALNRQHGAYQTPLYAAPVRTKDLTEYEIDVIEHSINSNTLQKGLPQGVYVVELIRAVIAADREKNK